MELRSLWLVEAHDGADGWQLREPLGEWTISSKAFKQTPTQNCQGDKTQLSTQIPRMTLITTSGKRPKGGEHWSLRWPGPHLGKECGQWWASESLDNKMFKCPGMMPMQQCAHTSTDIKTKRFGVSSRTKSNGSRRNQTNTSSMSHSRRLSCQDRVHERSILLETSKKNSRAC